MSVAVNIISAVIKSVVGDNVGNGLVKELADISIDGISENGIDKINDFISGKKAKMEHILSKRNMKSLNISDSAIDHVVEEIKDLFKYIEITDEVLRQCKYDSMNLRNFLWNEYCIYKGDNYIEYESEMKKCLFAVAEVLVKLVRESESFQQDVSIHISNSVDEINIGLQKISEYMEVNFDKLDADHQIMLDILCIILEQTKNFNIQNSDKENTKFQNNKKKDYIKKWNSRLFLHQYNNDKALTLANTFIMPDYRACEFFKETKYIKNMKYKGEKEERFSYDDKLDKVIKRFIKDKDICTMLIMGMPGIGKSSIISWLANEYRDNEDIILIKFCDLKRKELKKKVLLDVICNYLNCEKEDLKDKILVIDGFDEMKALDIGKELIDIFFNDIKDIEHFKCIITSRMGYIDPSNFNDVFEILEFNIDKIKVFYKNITGNQLKTNEIVSNKVLGIPVILYMAIMSDIDIIDTATKPELYNIIFAEKGGIFDKFYYRGKEYDKGAQPLRNQGNVTNYLTFLQKVAYEMFKSNNLVLTKTECEIPELEFQGDYISILEFPIKYLFENIKSHIEFIHNSIYEYFVSEYIFLEICNAVNDCQDEKELACKFGVLFKDNHLSKEICEFLRYKIKVSNLSDAFEDVYETFQLMIRNGMTYYMDRPNKNIIRCEINIFANMLEIVHLWEKEIYQFDDSIFDYINYSMKFELNLSKIDFCGKNLTGMNLDNLDLSFAELEGADLRGANLKNTNLIGANLKRANLEGAYLKSAIFSENQLQYLEKDNNLRGAKVYCNTNNAILDYI